MSLDFGMDGSPALAVAVVTSRDIGASNLHLFRFSVMGTCLAIYPRRFECRMRRRTW